MMFDTAEFEIFGVDTSVRVVTVKTKEIVVGEVDSKESETLNHLLQVGLSAEQPQVEDTTAVKQESFQVQQPVSEFEPEPEPSTSKDPGITSAPRHKPVINVTTSVHLDDENAVDILKELEVNVCLPKLSELEIKDATVSKIKLKPKADCKSKQASKEDTVVTKPKKVVKQSTFKLATHRQRKRVYNFKCCCNETFKSIKDWNQHHL